MLFLDQSFDHDIFENVDLRTKPARQPEIKTEMHDEIVEALQGDGIVVKSYKINIETSDLFCLTGENWLNDKIIEFYMKMIADTLPPHSTVTVWPHSVLGISWFVSSPLLGEVRPVHHHGGHQACNEHSQGPRRTLSNLFVICLHSMMKTTYEYLTVVDQNSVERATSEAYILCYENDIH